MLSLLLAGLLSALWWLYLDRHKIRPEVGTILLCMGVNVKVIQELLGHSDISVTLRVYGHLLLSMQQAVVDTWDGVFWDESEG